MMVLRVEVNKVAERRSQRNDELEKKNDGVSRTGARLRNFEEKRGQIGLLRF